MKRIVSKKGLALLVAALLVFALLPGAALADEPVAQIVLPRVLPSMIR